MNDETKSGADATQANDTEGHKTTARVDPAAAAAVDDTEGHKVHSSIDPAAAAAVDADDTEGHIGSIKK